MAASLAVRVEDEKLPRVIDRIVAVRCRADDHRHTPFPGDGLDGRLIGGGEADEFGIEVGHVLRQLRRRVAFRVDGYEDHLRKHRGLVGAQPLLQCRQRGERGRTEIRTIGVAEEQQGPVAAQILRPECPDPDGRSS